MNSPAAPHAPFKQTGQLLEEFPLVGLEQEKKRILSSIDHRQPLLVEGAGGAGKTRLLRLAEQGAKFPAVYLRFQPVLHDLLLSLATALLVAGDPFLRSRLHGEPSEAMSLLKAQKSISLRGMLWRSFEESPRILLLDGVDGATFPVFRFFERIYYCNGVAMIASTRALTRLGALHRLFWDPRSILTVAPLNDTDASALFDKAVQRYQLQDFDLEDFRPRVLSNAKGNPGQILEMCHFASKPQYQAGRHIKFAPLRIDVMSRFLA